MASDVSPLRSAHDGGVLLLFADGSVRFQSNNTNVDLVKLLAVRDDGETVDLN